MLSLSRCDHFRSLALLFFSFLVSSSFIVAQTSVYVDAVGDFTPANPADGEVVTWNGTDGVVTGLVFGTDAFETVQEGIDAVDEGGTVFIAAGEYQKGSVITVPEDKSLRLQGDGEDFTTLSRDDSQGADSANTHSVLATSASVGGSSIVSIDGMTVSGGRSIDSGSGGGISSARGTLLVSNCTVSGNTSARSFGSGGGIGGDEVTIVVNSSTVSGNLSEASGSGGGIGGLNPSITVINSMVNGNTSEGNSSGGGIGGEGATITVNNSTVSRNVSEGNSSGGGVGGRFSTITVNNSTVSGNTSEDQFSGGGIGGNSSTITVINSTVSDNTSEGVVSGGGIGGNLIQSLTLGNSLVVGNVATGSTSSAEIDGSVTTDNGGNLLSIPVGLNISDILAPLSRNGGPTQTHALVRNSPAIDAGVNANAAGLDFDQRSAGFPRILDSLVDVGAFELSSTANVYVDAAGDFTPVNPANGETVTWNGLSQGGPITGLIFGQNAFGSVQEGIDVVAESGTVFIAAGEYQKGSVITVPEDKSLTLHGDGADLTILSRDDSADTHSILSTSGENSTVTVDGMTISNGIASGRVSEGGGITSDRGNLVVMNSVVSGNRSLLIQSGGGIGGFFPTITVTNSVVRGNMSAGRSSGGGIGGFVPTITVTNSIVRGNTSEGSFSGGGIGGDNPMITVTNSTVSDNANTVNSIIGSSGGGIGGDRPTIIVTNSTVNDNTVNGDSSGGGIGGNNPTITVNNSTVRGNTSASLSSGGGIGGESPTIIVNNSTIIGNTSEDSASGGGIGGDRPTITVNNSTVSGNTCAGISSGGGIGGSRPTITVSNSTVSDNTSEGDSSGGGVGGTLIQSLTLGNSLVVGNVAAGATSSSEINGSISIDNGGNLLSIPSGLNISDILAPLADNGGPTQTHALVRNSPAIDVGVNANAAGLDFDQRGDGFPRILDSLVDVGAFELSSAAYVYVDSAGDFTPANPANGDTVTWNGLSQGGPVTGLIFGQNAFSSVQEGIDAVAESGIVFIAAGEYQKGSVIAVPFDKSLTLQGDGAEFTTLSRDDSAGASASNTNKHSVLATSQSGSGSSIVTINGMTISGGRSAFNSGGGGGITSSGGTVIVNNCTVSDNTSEEGFSGGGIGGNRLTITVNNSTVSGNTCEGSDSGGGIGGNNPTITVNNSTVSGNTCEGRESGGGIGGSTPIITVNSSTVSGNTSEGGTSGGGIGGDDPRITVNNSTVSGNTSAGISSGGGIGGLRPIITMNNSLVVGNVTTGPNSSREVRGNVTTDNGGNILSIPSGLTISDILAPLANNGGPTQTHALVVGGPAFNTGVNSAIPVDVLTDQRGDGFPRIFGNLVDVGAYEAQSDFNARPVIILNGNNPTTVECVESYTELATVSDVEDGDLTGSLVITGGPVVTTSPGSFTLRYNVTDSGGMAAIEVMRTVSVVDTTAPVISLTGDASIAVEAGTSFTDPGTTLTEVCDTALAVTVGGDVVDVNREGTYTITYNATDSSNNVATQVTRTVTVADTTAPVITLNGESSLTLTRNVDSYTEQGATAVDSFDSDVSVTIGGQTVDTTIAGIYVVTYDATDDSANAATQVTRTVNVVDTPSFSIAAADADQEEGDSGTTGFTFSISRTGSTAAAGTVDFSVPTSDDLIGTLSGTVSFAAGETEREITINVVGDTVIEPDETFTVTLSNPQPSGAQIATATADGVIQNDDSADTVYVDSAGDFTPANPSNGETVTWNGLSQGGPVIGLIFGQNAFGTVQEGIDVVSEGGTVFIAAGEYQKGSVITVPEDQSLTLQGDGAELTTLSRASRTNNHSVLATSGVRSIVTIDGMTISGGRSATASSGGGITSSRGTLIVNNSTVSGNTSEEIFSGGGIGGDRFIITVNNSTVSGNTSEDTVSGGGIGGSNPTITVNNSTVRGNTSERFNSGGGIGGSNPTITVNNSTVRGNTSAGFNSGGGIGGSNPTITVNNSTVRGNTSAGSSDGGGIGGNSPTITVNNSTVSGNTSEGNLSGGGIGGSAPRITVNNSTVSDNTSEGFDSGGGIGGSSIRSLTLGNSLVVGNVATGSNSSREIDGNVTTDNGGNLLSIPSGLNIFDILAPLADNGGSTQTHALVVGSPAFNRGNNSAIPVDVLTDQRGDGFPRIFGNLVDVGAYEAQRDLNAAPVITLNGNNPATVELGGSYTELATASDMEDGDLTGSLVITGGPIVTTSVGSFTLRYNVTDSGGMTATEVVRTVNVVDTIEVTVEVTEAPELSLQSGLFISQVTITNSTGSNISAQRLFVSGLPEDVTVHNATGTDSFGALPVGTPYLLSNLDLPAGGSVVFTVEFLRENLDPDFTPQYSVEILADDEVTAVAGESGVAVERMLALANGDFLIEFASQIGAEYAVEYSSDMVEWKRVTPTITAIANRTQWIDNGPPKTESHPSNTPQRFYRFVLLTLAD